MKGRWARAAIGSAALVWGALGCGHGADGAGSAQANTQDASVLTTESSSARPIELFSWWARVGESDALGALSREHRRHNPNDVIINATAELSGLARSTLRSRMEHDEPPDTFQANAGKDLMQWVVVNGLDQRESKLAPLDDAIDDVATWRKTMPAALLNEISYDGKLYAVPSDVHRVNAVYYNKKVFRTYNLTVPQTVDDFRAMGQKLQGTDVTLFALGSREPWTLALFAFECLLVTREGREFYESYFRGRLQPDDPRIAQTLKVALELLAFANGDHAQRSWVQALDLFVRGRAAIMVMGDWSPLSLAPRGMKNGEDYDEAAFPGSEGVFVYTSDTFPLPRQARNRAGAIRLLKTIGSAEGQRAMSIAKEALPARTDVAPVSPTLLAKYDLLQRGPLVLALSGLLAGRFADDLGAALAEMAAQQDIEPVMQTLKSRYPLLK